MRHSEGAVALACTVLAISRSHHQRDFSPHRRGPIGLRKIRVYATPPKAHALGMSPERGAACNEEVTTHACLRRFQRNVGRLREVVRGIRAVSILWQERLSGNR